MSVLEVRRIDEVFGVFLSDGAWRPIQANGELVQRFNVGWSPICVVDAFAPLHVLRLRHVDGAEASWMLDGDMLRLGDSIAHVAEHSRDPLRDRARALFGLVFDRIIAAPTPERPGDADDLAALCEATIRELVSLVLPTRLAGLVVVNLDDAAADAVLGPFGLHAAMLRATLSGSLPEAFQRRLRHGVWSCPSPIDGRPVEAEIGLPLTDRITAYRFTDRVAQQVFYVTAQDYHDCLAGLFLPGLGLYCIAGYAPDAHTLLELLLVHATLHQRRLRHILAAPSRGKVAVNFVSDYPTLHIGHVVWNELSGLQELVETLEPEFLPLVCVLAAASGSEAFGRLDDLFPEFAGKVLRPDVPWAHAAAHVYDNRWFFMRYKTRYVRSRVGERIRALVADDPVLERDRTIARRFADEGRTCILLGLRVGNRTLADIAGFMTIAIDHLVARLGRVAIVLDGTNNRLGLDVTTSYASFGPRGADEPLIEELRIALELRRRYGGVRDVEIVGTVGAPLACGLFWAARSRFFVAPWGAALAKYRRVCNRPGLVVTNRFNIGTPVGDLPIYHDPRFMEAPSPMRFVALDHVADAPGPAGFYANFDIDPQGLRDGIDALIELTAR